MASNKAEHGIVYTGKKAPSPLPSELPRRGEVGMQPIPIRIDPDDPTQKLQNESRINYGKVYTVEHNIKVHSVGMVNREALLALLGQFQQVWASSIGVPRGPLAPVREGQAESYAVAPQAGTKAAYAVLLKGLIEYGYSQEQAVGILEKRRREELASQSGATEVSQSGESEGSGNEDDSSSSEEEPEAGPSQPRGAQASAQRQQNQQPQTKQVHDKLQSHQRRDSKVGVQPKQVQASQMREEKWSTAARQKISAAVAVLEQRGMSHIDAVRAVNAQMTRDKVDVAASSNHGKEKAAAVLGNESEEDDNENDDEDGDEANESEESEGDDEEDDE